jgi:hypothetical protein
MYFKEQYSAINRSYLSGTELINCSAAGVVYKTISKILAEMNRKLAILGQQQTELDYSLLLKFIVDFLQFEIAEVALYAAFSAPKGDPFYQRADSKDWQRLKGITKVYDIVNQ